MYLNAILMVMCTILYSLHTCLLRYFKQISSTPLSSDLIACYQYLISIVILLPFIVRRFYKNRQLISNIPCYLVRCTMIFCATLSWFYALSQVPAVNCIAISCMTPIFILILAKISLHEQLTKEIIILGCIAFLGAIIILSPDFTAFNNASFFAILTAFLWALNSVFTKKKLSATNSSMTIFFFTAILLSCMALPYVLLKTHTISYQQIAFLIIITIVFDLANILLIWVFSRGKISLVAPFDFLRVVFTTIFSSVLLNEFVSRNAMLGMGIILIANALSTLYTNKMRIAVKTKTC